MQSEKWKLLTSEELQQKIDEDEIVERDWKKLDLALNCEKKNLKRAIEIYESFVAVSAKYPLPYLRLPIIYRKQKSIDDEIRVLETAVSVFERDKDERTLADAAARLDRARKILEKQK